MGKIVNWLPRPFPSTPLLHINKQFLVILPIDKTKDIIMQQYKKENQGIFLQGLRAGGNRKKNKKSRPDIGAAPNNKK